MGIADDTAPAAKRPWKWWHFALIGCGGLTLLPVLILCAGLMWLGTVATPTEMSRSPAHIRKFRGGMDDLLALEAGEKIRWFYSWGLKDLSEGFVALTDRNLLVYYGVELWDDETAQGEGWRIDFADVVGIDMTRGHTFEDGICTVHLQDGTVHEFPVSAERGNDTRFLADLRKAVEAAGGTGDPPPPGGF
ncbi:MAG: hypothetical protein ACYTGX_04425 [Planctomycetota bacterium]|jgi:hypothetical protein